MGKNNLIGMTFGQLTVLDHAVGTKPKVLARCSCGTEKVVRVDHLRAGRTTSCGCFRVSNTSRLFTTHGFTAGPFKAEWTIWYAMMRRCFNTNHKSYKDYGGRGITVCPQWIDNFQQFLADMGPRPYPDYTLERNDNDGNYEPANCRWATKFDQIHNRRVSYGR